MNYELLETPFEFPGYDVATKSQAKQYFEWRINTKEERIEYLSDYINKYWNNIELDYTVESFKSLWAWFEGIINKDDIPKDWHKEWDNVIPKYYIEKEYKEATKITIMGIIMDMGMYVGETLIRSFPDKLHWTVLTENGCYISSKRPIIKGEKEHDIIEPELIISTLAMRYAKYNTERNLLFNYFIAWIMTKIDGEYYKKVDYNMPLIYETEECPYYYSETDTMSPKRCDCYYKWFMDTRYERITYLDNYIKSCGEIVNLDYTPESLKDLLKWCMPKIYYVERIEEDYQEYLQSQPKSIRNMLENRFWPFETEKIFKDMSIYFGEIMIKNYPYILFWNFKKNDKYITAKNRIVIDGFPGEFKCRDPLGIIEREAMHIAFAKYQGISLFELYQEKLNELEE